MIVDAVVLLSISHYAQGTHQFVSILLGDGSCITESHESDCDLVALPIVALEKQKLAQKMDPHLRFMGYALVNYGEIQFELPAAAGDFLWHIQLQPSLYSQGYKYHGDSWSPIEITIESDPCAKIAVNDSLGPNNERDLHRAREILIQRIRNLRQQLDHCLSSPSNQLAQQKIGEIVMKTGQLRKIVSQIATLSLEERDSVNYEVMAQLMNKFSD